MPELVPLGALVQLYDATPKQLAPLSAETLGAVKSSVLQSSGAAKGGASHVDVRKWQAADSINISPFINDFFMFVHNVSTMMIT